MYVSCGAFLHAFTKAMQMIWAPSRHFQSISVYYLLRIADFFQMIFNRFCPFSFAWIDMVWLTKSSLVWKRFFLCHILHTSHWDWNGRVQWESACVKQLLTWAFFSLNNKQSTGSCNYAVAPLVAGAKIKGVGKGGKGSVFSGGPRKSPSLVATKNQCQKSNLTKSQILSVVNNSAVFWEFVK